MSLRTTKPKHTKKYASYKLKMITAGWRQSLPILALGGIVYILFNLVTRLLIEITWTWLYHNLSINVWVVAVCICHNYKRKLLGESNWIYFKGIYSFLLSSLTVKHMFSLLSCLVSNPLLSLSPVQCLVSLGHLVPVSYLHPLSPVSLFLLPFYKKYLHNFFSLGIILLLFQQKL